MVSTGEPQAARRARRRRTLTSLAPLSRSLTGRGGDRISATDEPQIIGGQRRLALSLAAEEADAIDTRRQGVAAESEMEGSQGRRPEALPGPPPRSLRIEDIRLVIRKLPRVRGTQDEHQLLGNVRQLDLGSRAGAPLLHRSQLNDDNVDRPHRKIGTRPAPGNETDPQGHEHR